MEESIDSARVENERRNNDFRQLELSVNTFGYKILKNVPYDGNCFFNAVAELTNESGLELRKRVIEFIRTERNSDSGALYDDDLIECLQRLYQDVQDTRVVKAVADLKNRRVQVITHFRDGRPSRVETVNGRGCSPLSQPLVLGHIADSHFVPLIAKRPNTQEPVTSGRKKKKTDNTRQLITNFFATKQTPASVPAAASTDDNSPGSELSHEMQCLNEQVQASMEETTTNEEPSEQERVSTEEQIATEEPLNDQILMQDTEESPSGAENQHCNLQNRPNYNDIGFILNATMSAEDAINAISNLSDQEKYKLLKRHFIPPPSYTFRPRLQYGISRKCPKEFNRSYPWLVYSDNLDGVFCIHCALFAKDRLQLNEIVNAPFNNWSKFKRKMDTHGKALYHRDALDDSKAFEAKMEQPNTTLPRIVNKELKQRAHDNEQILRHIISAVLFCAKQCIGLRGTNESIENITSNPGNFLAFLKVKSEDDEVLKNHLDNPKHRNVTYISPQIQNELIEVMGDIVSRSLVKELIEAGYYTIMADEVTSHNKEYMPLCVRFVDNERNIREEFLEFVQVERITGQYLATTIKSVLNRHHIPLHLMRGQCYDGAANMSSDRCGVQKYVMEESPMAPYTRCNSHALNLVIVHACKNTHISHTLTKMKEICMFFKYSPKRAGLLESIIKQGAPSAERRKPMLDLCKTRWAERHHAYEHFYDAYVFIVEALEFISHGLHKQKYDLNVFDGTWDATSRKDACSLLHAITDFGFITVFMVLYQGLGALSGISVQLQQKALDVYDAFSKVDAVIKTYKSLRENIDARFHTWFSHAIRMSERVGVEPSMPRLARGGRQIHRPNADIPADCECSADLSSPCIHRIETYFRLNYGIPFIDHVIIELDLQFSELSRASSQLLALVPSVMNEREASITAIADTYSSDLPSPALIDEEYERWRDEHKQSNVENLPDSCAKAILQCDETRYPNIFVLLKIACTLPVTSAECERSASVLRRLNHYTRASMKTDRMSSLALLHIHYNYPHSYTDIISEFVKLHPRRMELESVIFPPGSGKQ